MTLPGPAAGAKLWSAPATRGGQLPQRGDDVVIPASDEVYVDFVLVPQAGSLDELKQSGGDTYFYDGGAQKLWIKPVLGGTGTSLLDGIQTSVIALSGG